MGNLGFLGVYFNEHHGSACSHYSLEAFADLTSPSQLPTKYDWFWNTRHSHSFQGSHETDDIYSLCFEIFNCWEKNLFFSIWQITYFFWQLFFHVLSQRATTNMQLHRESWANFPVSCLTGTIFLLFSCELSNRQIFLWVV